jgi:hypothetical protein
MVPLLTLDQSSWGLTSGDALPGFMAGCRGAQAAAQG